MTGLGHGDARALLETAITGRLDARVHDRIIAETRGNPLALLELPRDLTAAELAGGFALPDAQPLAGRIEQSFVHRLSELPAATRRLLLVAASEPIGDVSLLWRAADGLGITADAAAPAESADLIEFRARVRFRHPLVRSAAYRAATSTDRREAHRALADATDPDTDPDRRAWHRAHAAAGPDEVVAHELERSADRALSRGGVAAAAAFLARAVELTPDPGRRGPRALAAAQAKFDAGAPDAAFALLTTAELGPLDYLQRARLQRLRRRSPSRAHEAGMPGSCCSPRPDASSHSTQRWPVRRISRRSERRSSRVASTMATACRTRSRPCAMRLPLLAPHVRSICCWMASRRGSRTGTQRASSRSGERSHRSTARSSPTATTTCAGCGSPAPSPRSRSRPICGTTTRGTTSPPARSGWLATPAR